MNKQQLQKYLHEQLLKHHEQAIKPEDTFKELTKIKITMSDAIEAYLAKDPYDIEMLFNRAMIYDCFEDQIIAIECLDTILELEPNNSDAFIARFMMHFKLPDLTQEIYDELNAYVHPDPKVMAIIEYLKSQYCMFHEESLTPEGKKFGELQIKHLEKSVSMCDAYVWPYKALGLAYLCDKKIHKAAYCFLKALGNIKHVTGLKTCVYDILSIKVFIDNEITGVELGENLYHHILALYVNFTLHSPCSGETCEYQ